MKTGLVLEGGAMRGIYTAGVLDVFMDNNINFDCVIGVSAGAIHGCTYVAGQKGRNIRYYKKYCRNIHFMSLYSLLTTGSMVGEQFCYHELPDKLDPFDYKAFKESPTDFYAVCTDLEKGTPVYVHINELHSQMDYLLASASMPMVSRIVEAGGRKLLDGGVSDSIPVRAAQKLGCDKIVVVQTREEGYFKKKPEGNLVSDRMYCDYPEFVRAIHNRHIMYNAQKKYVSNLEIMGKIVAVRPSRHVNISRTEKRVERLEEMYRLGRMDAYGKLAEIVEYLQ